jgi:hypothetical protein
VRNATQPALKKFEIFWPLPIMFFFKKVTRLALYLWELILFHFEVLLQVQRKVLLQVRSLGAKHKSLGIM